MYSRLYVELYPSRTISFLISKGSFVIGLDHRRNWVNESHLVRDHKLFKESVKLLPDLLIIRRSYFNFDFNLFEIHSDVLYFLK